MSSYNFTPKPGFTASDEKDWKANLGMLDWDNSSIVFTKRELVDFLRYVGVTVDPNWTNVSKIPRYAKIGKALTAGAASDAAGGVESSPTPASTSASPAAEQNNSTTGGFKPSRRVRHTPGGPTTINLFGDDEEPAYAGAPAQTVTTSNEPASSDALEEKASSLSLEEATPAQQGQPGFRPTRRVREIPGGKDSINSIFGDF